MCSLPQEDATLDKAADIVREWKKSLAGKLWGPMDAAWTTLRAAHLINSGDDITGVNMFVIRR